jgi:hypothetical protein
VGVGSFVSVSMSVSGVSVVYQQCVSVTGVGLRATWARAVAVSILSVSNGVSVLYSVPAWAWGRERGAASVGPRACVSEHFEREWSVSVVPVRGAAGNVGLLSVSMIERLCFSKYLSVGLRGDYAVAAR